MRLKMIGFIFFSGFLHAEADPNDLRVFWQNGLRLENETGTLRFQTGGRFQNDFAVFGGGTDLPDTATGFRRARLYVAGRFDDRLSFRTEYDFAGGTPGFRDVVLGLHGVPAVGNVRVGRMLEPFGLEGTSPNAYFTLIERGLPAAFTPFRNSGIQLNRSAFEERMTWAGGAFLQTDGFGESGKETGHAFTGRATVLPYYGDGGRRWWQIGFSGSHREPAGDQVRYRARPEAFVAPVFLDTGELAADRVRLFSVEQVLTQGPFSLQAEMARSEVRLTESEEAEVLFTGYYVYASAFLTGEHRPLQPGSGALGRVIPHRNFNPAEGGYGAWEVAVRYSVLDLDDGPVRGGRLQNTTLGVNAYLTPNLRVSCNLIYADLEDGASSRIGMMRVYVDF